VLTISQMLSPTVEFRMPSAQIRLSVPQGERCEVGLAPLGSIPVGQLSQPILVLTPMSRILREILRLCYLAWWHFGSQDGRKTNGTES
jgi:hypothetical protein